MIEDQTIVLDGRTYEWQHDAQCAPQLSWRWIEVGRDLEPPGAVRCELNGRFLGQVAAGMVASMEPSERERFRIILRSMEARGPQINRILGDTNDQVDDDMDTGAEAAKSNVESKTPFNDRALRDWFFANREPPAWYPRSVTLLGERPFSQRDFQEFVSRFQVESRPHDNSTTVLILGRTGWSETKIDAIIDDQNDNPLRIYSQEMFLAHLGCGIDPFLSREVANRFKRSHAGLKFVASGWRGWVEPWTRGVNRGVIQRVDCSPLKVLGYTVGLNGVPEDERRAILRRAFEDELPFVVNSEYMAEWGHDGSALRLRRMAEHLAGMCRAASANGNLLHALTDWYLDLSWLKTEFYRGHMNFNWPEDCIRPVRERV